MKPERKAELRARFEKRKTEYFKKKRRKRYSLVEAVKTVGELAKALFRPDTHFGVYLRNGFGFLALGFATNYCDDPFPLVYASPLIFAVGAYNFIQAFRHKDEVPAKYIEEFRARYRQEREERRRNR